MAFRFTVSGVLIAALVVAGCVSDPKVEDDVTPAVGATQPAGNGSTLTAAEACQALAEAETAARERLGCEDREITCPAHVFLAGATPCAAYDEASVEACADVMDGYGSCDDFGTKPCVVTLSVDSCTPPVPPEAGPGDAEAGAPDTGVGDGGDGGGGGDAADAADAADATVTDAGDGAAPVDAGDAGADGAPEGGASDGG